VIAATESPTEARSAHFMTGFAFGFLAREVMAGSGLARLGDRDAVQRAWCSELLGARCAVRHGEPCGLAGRLSGAR
jgi:hypothetical protein